MRLHMPRGLAFRITLTALLAAALALGIVAIGVLVVARSTFEHLMVSAGSSAAAAQEMFDRSVALIVAIAIAVAVVVTGTVSILLSLRLARPLNTMAVATQRIAAGDYAARVGGDGPAEVAAVSNAFNAMAETLERQDRVRREFVINAAHELRTPLTNLQGYVEALRDGVVPPSHEQFTSLLQEVERLVRLADSLETLASSDQTDPGPAVLIDVAPVLRTAADIARPMFVAKSIGLDLDVPQQLRARVHPDRLKQVLFNLLQNAARYTPDGGGVSMSARPARGTVHVVVSNSGDGIPADDLPRVWERFYRVEKSRDQTHGGAGVGLAIVKQLVELDGGEVGAESAAGATRFWCRLPS